jgi:hypothetical protein
MINIRSLTPSQLQALGTPQLAYVRPIVSNGMAAYAIHSADGTPMAIAADRDLAIAAVIQNEMFPSSVH